MNVSRTPAASGQFNISCQAGPTYPRPALALYRYRAGQLEAAGREQPAAGHAQRPRLAATSLRQEPLAGAQTQLTIGASRWPRGQPEQEAQRAPLSPPDSAGPEALAELAAAGDQRHERPANSAGPRSGLYEIVAWALVDESTLSANLVTQFECVLAIEGTRFEQRQSLALQKGE